MEMFLNKWYNDFGILRSKQCFGIARSISPFDICGASTGGRATGKVFPKKLNGTSTEVLKGPSSEALLLEGVTRTELRGGIMLIEENPQAQIFLYRK